MIKRKKKALLIVILLGIPAVYGTSFLVEYLAPDNLSDYDRALWVGQWTGAISIIIPLLILAALYRFWISKKEK